MLRATLLAGLLALALLPATATANHEECGPARLLVGPVEVYLVLWSPTWGASCLGAAAAVRMDCPLGPDGQPLGPASVGAMEDFTGWCHLATVWVPL